MQILEPVIHQEGTLWWYAYISDELKLVFMNIDDIDNVIYLFIYLFIIDLSFTSK